MTDRDFQAEFQDLLQKLDASRRDAISKEGGGTPEAIARSETAKHEWRVVKEQIKDLLDHWEEEGGLTRTAP